MMSYDLTPYVNLILRVKVNFDVGFVVLNCSKFLNNHCKKNEYKITVLNMKYETELSQSGLELSRFWYGLNDLIGPRSLSDKCRLEKLIFLTEDLL